MNYRELLAPDLVKLWKQIVNKHVMMGRDAHLMKEFLQRANSVQIVLGMYHYKDVGTISIPMFIKQYNDWLEIDEEWAEVELAVCITDTVPTFYNIYVENNDSFNAEYYIQAQEARELLFEWKERILA